MSKVLVNNVADARGQINVARAIGSDICDVYINMLCERYKNRGVTTRVKCDADAQSSRHKIAVCNAPGAYSIDYMRVSPFDAKYRTGSYKGKSYMSSEDFALYYRDLRDYRTPRQASRAEEEYAEIQQRSIEKKKEIEAGTRSKKAKWLALTHTVKSKIKEVKSRLNLEEFKRFSADWFPADCEENRREGKTKKMPRGIVPSFVIVGLSLLLIVSGSVMVSRAEMKVSDLEYQIDSYEATRDELLVDIELKNDMLMVKEWAMQNGMVSGEYVNSKHIDIENPESIESFEKKEEKGFFHKLLIAIGLDKSE